MTDIFPPDFKVNKFKARDMFIQSLKQGEMVHRPQMLKNSLNSFLKDRHFWSKYDHHP